MDSSRAQSVRSGDYVGKDWFAFPIAGGSYHLRVTEDTSFVVSYID